MPGFFDKMKASVGEKVIEASIRSKEALETQQMKSKIGGLQDQKKNALLELGNATYEMYASSSIDQEALTQQCEAIAAIDVQIKEREAELEEIHKRAEELLAEQKAAEEAKAKGGAPAAGAVPFCPECGTKIEGSPRFCPSCGHKLA